MSKVLITGASGFVGSWIVEEALSRGLDVYAGIRKSSSKEYLADKRINFVYLNFDDQVSLTSILEEHQFQYVIHNAGVVRALKKDTFFKVNVNYTKRLVETCKSVLTDFRKFVYISSVAASGPADESEEAALTPQMTLQPVTEYGKSKKASEIYLHEAGLPYMILRPTGVYGPRDRDIFLLFKAVKSGIVPLIGLKKSDVSFIYVKDLARLLLDATLSNDSNRTYVVSDGEKYTDNEFHQHVARMMGKKPFYPKIPIPIVYVFALFAQIKSRLTSSPNTFDINKVMELKARNWYCDISDLEKDFNFAPQLSLQDSLRETYEWYKSKNWL